MTTVPCRRWRSPARLYVIIAPAAVAALAACGSQASSEYDGESLLTLTGSVELALDREDATELRPALAFLDYEQSELRVVDVDVTGKFPAAFTLDVYVPPPEQSFVTASKSLPDEPKIAIGYITAVRADHPKVIRFAAFSTGSAPSCTADGCRSVYQACTNDGSECYVETRMCPAFDSSLEDCTIMRTGDPKLQQDQFWDFAGLSENYVVVYSKARVVAGSYTAYVLGAAHTLEAGYHLLRIKPGASDGPHEQGICGGHAADLAAARYNQAHGTDYTIQDGYCGMNDCPDSVLEEYDRLRLLAKAELECQGAVVAAPVADPSHTPIDVRVGPNVRPLGQE